MWKFSIAAMLAGITIAASAPTAGAAAINHSRAAAIHQCAAPVQRYPETTFSSLEFERYRACMAERGRIE
jgi:hypothetical protein